VAHEGLALVLADAFEMKGNAQRLVRTLCGECRSSRPATDEEIEELLADCVHAFGREVRLHMHHAPGCTHCDNAGFRGRDGATTIDEVRATGNPQCAVPQTPAGRQTGGEG